jgi:hypothetical protein
VALPKDSRARVDQIAGETLKQFEEVAAAARANIGSAPGATVNSLASINTYTSSAAVNRLAQINDENQQSYLQLAEEPAIARVVVEYEDGQRQTYFICRATPLLGMASYRSPVGQLAAKPVGSTLALPRGTVEILEKARLRPQSKGGLWDSIDSIVEGNDYGPITVESFRALLAGGSAEKVGDDELERLLALDSESSNFLEGIRRSVITKMGLRDQPILDQYQDEIFRLPLASRLLILGPPGTGKTTTLIRRLGQKLDVAYLDEDERRVVDASGTEGLSQHSQSWLMFTPTDLLKQYVKEAFNREGVPASEDRITTWSDYRRILGRRVLNVLKTSSPGGTFILKDALVSLGDDAHNKMLAWYEDFEDWHKATHFEEILAAAEALGDDVENAAAALGRRLLSIASSNNKGSAAALLMALAGEADSVQGLIAGLKTVTDKKIRESLSLQVNRNKLFLHELASFLDGIQETPTTEVDEADDLEADEEDEVEPPKTPIAKALLAYTKAIRTQCRAVARKRGINKATRSGKILEWIGDRTLAETDRSVVGASLLVQSRARRFVNPVKKYIEGIPKRYRAFRRLRQSEGTWYRPDGFAHSDIAPLELDVVLLAMLRGGGELLSVASVSRRIDAPAWSSLQPILGLFRNQILVDEATDFSPIQLACMAAMASPRLRSFFACGDFNQRLTSWGSRSVDEVKWIFPEIEIKAVAVAYRQSRQLNEFASSLVKLAGGVDSGVALPEHVNSEGVLPILVEGLADRAEVAGWLGGRIQEIESFVNQLPSIAVLVSSESEVQPVADALNSVLADLSIRAVACLNGQTIGQGNDVRVFDVQHIKGMEFEAVFFVGIDRLASLQPELFDKYLYVGSTRAATYLGVTCEGTLPTSLGGLRSMFGASWQ